MKKLLDKVPINQLYNITQNYKLSLGDTNYYGSLTPEWSKLKLVQHIHFVVSLLVPDKSTQLSYENNINVHKFKPRYYQLSSTQLICYVASSEIMAHTLKALAIVAHSLKLSIEISSTDEKHNIIGLNPDWTIHPNIIICRVESMINFLKIISCLKSNQYDQNQIKAYAINFELSRINNYTPFTPLESLTNHSIKIDTLTTESPYIFGANIIYDNVPITLIQLPWGKSLSIQLMEFIFNSKSNVNRIGFIGGVGYLRNDDIDVDDIFIPQYLLVNDSLNTLTRTIDNKIIGIGNNSIFSNKKVKTGRLTTLTPEIGKLSNLSNLSESVINKIDAVDMELEFFYTYLCNYHDIEKAYCYYVMDKPYSGLGLGLTYYNREFLKKLYSTFDRGKYQCFEIILNFILDHKL